MLETEVMDAPVSGGGDFDSELTAALAGTFDSNATAPPEPEAEAIPEPEAPAAEEIAPEAEAAPEGEVAPAPVATDGPYSLSADGKSYVVPKQEFDTAISSALKYAEAVQAKFPTPGEAELAYNQASDFRSMQSDYLNGDDASLDAMLKFWAGQEGVHDAYKGQFQSSFGKLVTRMPEILKSVNPQAHQAMADGIVNSRIEAAYAKAAESGDPNDLLAAQHLDWGATGKYKTELPKVDPQKAEMDRLAQERQQLDQRTAGLLERDWNNFNQTQLNGEKWKQFDAEIARALEPVKGKYSDALMGAIRKDVRSNLLESLKNNYEWARNHENTNRFLKSSYEQAWREQKSVDHLKPQIQAYMNDFLGKTRALLPSVVKPILQDATASTVANSNPRAAAAPKAPPANANAAPRRNTPPADPREAFENEFSQFFRSKLPK